MQFCPEKKIAPAALLAALFLGTAAVFLCLFALSLGLAPLNLSSALLCAAFSFLILRRYLLTDMVYYLRPGDSLCPEGRPARLSFHIVVGKSTRTQGVLCLADCEALLRWDRQAGKAVKKRKCRGNLCTNLWSPHRAALLYTDPDNGQPCYLLFEPTGAFLSLLQRTLQEEASQGPAPFLGKAHPFWTRSDPGTGTAD